MIILPELKEIKDPVIMLPSGALTLTDALIDYDIDKHDYLARRSVINGHLSVSSRGEYFEGSIDVFDITRANYLALKGLVGSTVRLWPFGSGQAQSAPAKYYPYVDVVILTFTPYHRNNAYYLDAAIITFASQKPYTLKLADNTGIIVDPET